jgi:hypothetical protein
MVLIPEDGLKVRVSNETPACRCARRFYHMYNASRLEPQTFQSISLADRVVEVEHWLEQELIIGALALGLVLTGPASGCLLASKGKGRTDCI